VRERWIASAFFYILSVLTCRAENQATRRVPLGRERRPFAARVRLGVPADDMPQVIARRLGSGDSQRKKPSVQQSRAMSEEWGEAAKHNPTK
jgi:hypothetical protein